MDSQTLHYYNQNASSFVSDTVSVDFREIQDKFLGRLLKGNLILDFGCGSGRDTKYFLEQGFLVEAVDGSEKLGRLAQEYTGIEVKNMLFQDLDAEQRYDGIWACASILHLPKKKLKDVLIHMEKALHNDGIIYTSFKHGDFSGVRNGRYFTDFTENYFRVFIAEIAQLVIEELWITDDVRTGRQDEKWLNTILRTTRR